MAAAVGRPGYAAVRLQGRALTNSSTPPRPALRSEDPRRARRTRAGAVAGSARERILSTASQLFYACGIRGTGVDTIIAESAVAKATFYKHFPAKDDLVVAYLDRVDEMWRSALTEAAQAAGADPADQMVGMFDALRSACRRDGYRGCAFINTAAESGTGGVAHSRTVRHKEDVRTWLRALASQAGAQNPDALARALTLLLDGGLAAGALDADPAAADAAKDSARTLVQQALGR